MKKTEFIDAVTGLVYVYINNQDGYGKNAQIRVNPELLTVDLFTEKEFLQGLADSEEVIENAAYASRLEDETAADYQAAQNPDFYPVGTLLKKEGQDLRPDPLAIGALAENYRF